METMIFLIEKIISPIMMATFLNESVLFPTEKLAG